MTLATTIRERCASYSLGHCLGVDAYSRPFRPEGKCLVLESERCPYFERVVLADLRQRGLAGDALRQYEKFAGPAAGPRAVRRCECGAEIPKGHRTCSECARKNRRETYRRAQRKHREVSSLHVNS